VEKSAAQTRDWIATARTLSEALPFLQRYDGATVVIKFGGHAMGDDAALDEFARDVVLMKQCNVNAVVVHGGGPMIDEMLKRLGIASEFVAGKRVTGAAAVEVVEMVLSGRINKRIVQAINAQGGRAVGLSGKDANLMVCEKDLGAGDVDLGFVGRPVEVNPAVLRTFLSSDFIPVVAPIGAGRGGETFNVNGDTAAIAPAAAAAQNAGRGGGGEGVGGRCLHRRVTLRACLPGGPHLYDKECVSQTKSLSHRHFSCRSA